jgi:hypothetical protein
MRITDKQVQTVFHCVCGYNVVDHELLPIRWKDLTAAGIRRRVDRTTRKPFLLQVINSTECNCYEEQ